MTRRDFFADSHPLTGFVLFLLTLGCAMLLWHPACILISLAGALAWRLRLDWARPVGRSLCLLLPLMLLTAAINPLFNHGGATILAYFPSGNPLTLESILFGLAAAGLLGAAVLWFSCCAAVMTSDKLIWLLGRVLPVLSLLLSMALRFVPRLRARFREVNESRHALGRGCGDGDLLRRARNTAAVFSILITWSLESAIETADSMKGRGYGLGGRTAFSVYRLERRDALALLWLFLCALAMVAGGGLGAFRWRWFPTVRGDGGQPGFFAVYLALCLTPAALNVWEERAWNSSRSGI